MVLGEFFEDVLRGGDDLALAVLHGLGEEHLVEEDVAELLGGVDVEAVAGVGVDAFGEVVDLDGEARGHARGGQSGLMRTPACSMRRRTGTSGRSMVL